MEITVEDPGNDLRDIRRIGSGGWRADFTGIESSKATDKTKSLTFA